MDGEMDRETAAKLGAKGVVFNMGAAGISKFSGLLFYILLLRFVTPAEGGVYFIYLAVANLIGLLGAFGIADALARFIPFYEGGGQRAKVKPLVYTAFISFAFFSLIAGAAAFAARDWIAGSYSRGLAGILAVTVLSGIAIALGTLLNSALLGLKRFGEVALYSAALLMALYVADFFVKAKSGFPHTPGKFRDGKLYAPGNRIRGLVHVLMRVFNGIGEPELVLAFVIIQGAVAAAVLAVFLYVKVF